MLQRRSLAAFLLVRSAVKYAIMYVGGDADDGLLMDACLSGSSYRQIFLEGN